MIEPDEMPTSLVERATLMQNLLMARATGLSADSEVYEALRREFMANEALKQLLPDFVRTCRSLDVFWPHIQSKSGRYAERRHIIGTAFNPLFDYLEQGHRAPVDAAASETLQTFDAGGVHAVWEKALTRRHTDPEGAITVARTLLETVCKRILDDVRELDRVLNKENGNIVSDEIPVALLGIELDGKPAHITRQIGRAFAARHG